MVETSGSACTESAAAYLHGTSVLGEETLAQRLMQLLCIDHAKMQMAGLGTTGLHTTDKLYVYCSSIAHELRPRLTHPAACASRTPTSAQGACVTRARTAIRAHAYMWIVMQVPDYLSTATLLEYILQEGNRS